jgi:uncharacterized protein (DUF952 family)
MPKIVGRSVRVVDDAENGLTIDEYAGNVGSNDDTMSLAVVRVTKPCSEPWLTLDYDEWIAVLKGRVDFYFDPTTTTTATSEGDGEDGGAAAPSSEQMMMISATAGETVFIGRGERFRPVFPVGGTEYVPVCIPAFRPERCLREEVGGTNTSQIAVKLKELHEATGDDKGGAAASLSCGDAGGGGGDDDGGHPDTLYHMCDKALWEAAVAAGRAYFPPTFAADGGFTHATAVPGRLLDTANHFYTSSKGDWICLQLSARALRDRCGIVTKFEGPLPVGDASVSDDWTQSQWVCPHIYGGIPVSVDGIVTATYPIWRDDADGRFLSIVGLL